MLTILNLGGGVQSSTMAMMATHGEIDMPDRAVFADTHAEPASVYRWLEWLVPKLPLPVDVVSAGDLRAEVLDAAANKGNSWGRPPFFVRGVNGSEAMLSRQCTSDYKIDPIRRYLRKRLGLKPRQRAPKEPVVEQWVGISTDEVRRAKLAREPWISTRFPLIEQRMTRNDCIAWMTRHGYPTPPRSACVFCPYHTNNEWLQLRDNDPEAFAEALRVDTAIRGGGCMGCMQKRSSFTAVSAPCRKHCRRRMTWSKGSYG
ncbi:hypothetical protein [Thioalbus denitrificans]|uniref:hypothetical protein n=1 Tax=Thioalbus denitrificans TaxID=547122 RepID=UPI001B879AF5|nr:hypothetical protein [Thioalbus denitrificans]